MTAWLAMTVAAVASTTIGKQRPVRRHQEERVFDRRRVSEHQRALAEIVERQRGQHDASHAAWIGRGRNGRGRHRAPPRR